MTGIFITSVIQPETGAIILTHCPECKAAVITVSEYACKPEHGDLWVMRGCCVDAIPTHIFGNNSPTPEPRFCNGM